MLSDPEFRELVTLPLPTSVVRELTKVGYTNVGEVSGLTVEQIAFSKQIIFFSSIHSLSLRDFRSYAC